MNNDEYIIPMLLSDYVETLDDWEIVEYVSRFEATSKFMKNGAPQAKYEEMIRVWQKRYPGEEIMIMECVPLILLRL